MLPRENQTADRNCPGVNQVGTLRAGIRPRAPAGSSSASSGHDRSGSSVKLEYLLWMDPIELRQQHYALLLVGIRAGNNRNAALRTAEVMGQISHTGRGGDKVPAPSTD